MSDIPDPEELSQESIEQVDSGTVEAEAQSLIKLFNTAAPDRSPELEWFAMGLDHETMEQAFVFEAKGYIDPDGLAALRGVGRVPEYIEGYQKLPAGDVYCQIQIATQGEVVQA